MRLRAKSGARLKISRSAENCGCRDVSQSPLTSSARSATRLIFSRRQTTCVCVTVKYQDQYPDTWPWPRCHEDKPVYQNEICRWKPSNVRAKQDREINRQTDEDEDDEIAYFTVRWKTRASFVYRTDRQTDTETDVIESTGGKNKMSILKLDPGGYESRPTTPTTCLGAGHSG